MQKIEKLLRTQGEPARRACKGVWKMSQPYLCIYIMLKIVVYYSQAFSKEKVVSVPWRAFLKTPAVCHAIVDVRRHSCVAAVFRVCGLSNASCKCTWNLVTCLIVVILCALTSGDLTPISGVWDRILRSQLCLIQVQVTSQAFKMPTYFAHDIYGDVYLCFREETARFTHPVSLGALLANQNRIF